MDSNSHGCITKKTAVYLGIAGILGSLLLFAGDMLFYYNGDQANFVANMAVSSSDRIMMSGGTALLAAWLYTLASGQLLYAFQPAKRWVQMTVFLSFTAVMIAYGVIHGEYVAIATSAQNAVALGAAPDTLIDLAARTNDMLRTITYIPFALFTIIFTPAVWMKKTYYPRWILLFSPVVLFFLNDLITAPLTGKIKIIIGGGYLNLLLFIFFSASTIALQRKEN